MYCTLGQGLPDRTLCKTIGHSQEYQTPYHQGLKLERWHQFLGGGGGKKTLEVPTKGILTVGYEHSF